MQVLLYPPMKKYGIKHEVATSRKIHNANCRICSTYEWKVSKRRERHEARLLANKEKEDFLDWLEELL